MMEQEGRRQEHDEQLEMQQVEQVEQMPEQWAPSFEEVFGAEQITSPAILEEKKRMEAWYETWKQTIRDKDEEIFQRKASVELVQAQVRSAEAEKVALEAILASEIEGRTQATAKIQALQHQIDALVDDQEALAEVTRRMEGIRQTADLQNDARNTALETLLTEIEEIRLEYSEELAEIEDEIRAKQQQFINQQNILSGLLAESADKKIKITEADREVMELEEACNKYEKEYTKLRAQTEFERKKIAEKAAQLQKSGAELTEAIAQSARLKDEMDKAEAHLAEVQTKHDRVRTECELRENERSKMVEENAAFIAALEGELLKQEQDEAELDEKIAEMEANEPRLLEGLKTEEVRKEELAVTLAENERAVEKENTEIEELKVKIAGEEQRIEAMEISRAHRKEAFNEEVNTLKAKNEVSRLAIQRKQEKITRKEEELRQIAMLGEEFLRLAEEVKGLQITACKLSDINARCTGEQEKVDQLQHKFKAKKEELAAMKKNDQKEVKAHEAVDRQLKQAKDNLIDVQKVLARALNRKMDWKDIGQAIEDFAAGYEKKKEQLREYNAQIEKETKQNTKLEYELVDLENEILKTEELKATLEAEQMEEEEEKGGGRPQSQPTQGTQERRATIMAPPASKPGQVSRYTPVPKRSRQERAYSVGSSESEYINASVRSVSVNSVERRASALGISKHESQTRLALAGASSTRRGVSRSQEELSQEPVAAASSRGRGRGRPRGSGRGGATRGTFRAKNRLDLL